MLNSKRFINSYNKIDIQLRNLYNFKSSVTFSDMIRKSSPLNHIVRRYENVLIDFARLRNAIVHKSVDEMIIAEPNDYATAEFEKIERLICTPPLLIKSFLPREIMIVKSNTKLNVAIKTMSQSHFSNIPIVDEHNKLIGIMNNKRIIENIGRKLDQNISIDEFLDKCEVKEIVKETDIGIYYQILNANATLPEVIKLFEDNKKMIAVLVTQNGDFMSKILNIVTSFDLAQINKILEDF